LQLADGEAGEKWARGSLCELRRSDGLERGGGQRENFARGNGEVVAGEKIGAGDMEEASLFAFDESDGSGGEIGVVSGSGELVGGRLHGVAGLENAAERVEIIFALRVRAVDGGGA